jgi:hypothetical protein
MAFAALTIGTIAIAASNSASRTMLHVRSCMFAPPFFSYATLDRHGKIFIRTEDEVLMPTGGTGFNEGCRLVDPSSSFRDNPRLSTYGRFVIVAFMFSNAVIYRPGTEKMEKRRPAKYELNSEFVEFLRSPARARLPSISGRPLQVRGPKPVRPGLSEFPG